MIKNIQTRNFISKIERSIKSGFGNLNKTQKILLFLSFFLFSFSSFLFFSLSFLSHLFFFSFPDLFFPHMNFNAPRPDPTTLGVGEPLPTKPSLRHRRSHPENAPNGASQQRVSRERRASPILHLTKPLRHHPHAFNFSSSSCYNLQFPLHVSKTSTSPGANRGHPSQLHHCLCAQPPPSRAKPRLGRASHGLTTPVIALICPYRELTEKLPPSLITSSIV